MSVYDLKMVKLELHVNMYKSEINLVNLHVLITLR